MELYLKSETYDLTQRIFLKVIDHYFTIFSNQCNMPSI